VFKPTKTEVEIQLNYGRSIIIEHLMSYTTVLEQNKKGTKSKEKLYNKFQARRQYDNEHFSIGIVIKLKKPFPFLLITTEKRG